MKKIDDKNLDVLIEKMKDHSPKLEDKQVVVDDVMRKINKRSFRSKNVYLLWVRTISSVAAVFLLTLFIFQYNETSFVVKRESNHLFEKNIKLNQECLNIMEKNQGSLLETYFCHLRHNSLKNEQFYSLYRLKSY